MAATTFKILLFMKRRPDITVEAFRDYYENSHAPLCAKYSAGMSIRAHIPRPGRRARWTSM